MILLPTAWLATAAFFVIVCRMAGRSDAALAGSGERSAEPLPTVSLSTPPRARWHEAPRMAPSRATIALSRAGRPARERSGSCVAGS